MRNVYSLSGNHCVASTSRCHHMPEFQVRSFHLHYLVLTHCNCSSSGSSEGHFGTCGSDSENCQGTTPRRYLDHVGNSPTDKSPTQNRGLHQVGFVQPFSSHRTHSHLFFALLGRYGMRSMYPRCLSSCLFNSTLGYTRSLAGGSQMLLRDCLMDIHKDIITCWNFKGKVVNYHRFGRFFLDLRLRL